MNYKSITRSALAVALGLAVGSASADVQKFFDDFEAYNDGDLLSEIGATQQSDTANWWVGGEDDTSAIISEDGNQLLQLNTEGGTVSNKMSSAVISDLNDGIAADGILIESKIQFVASDDDKTIPTGDDLKFAFFAYADEDTEPAKTNLVVSHAIMLAGGSVIKTNTVTCYAVDCDELTPVKVTMKKFTGEYGAGVKAPVAFQVELDGVVVTNANAYTAAALGEDYNGTAGGNDACWFLISSMGNGEASARENVSAVALQGTGKIDDVKLSTIVTIPDFFTVNGVNYKEAQDQSAFAAAVAGNYTVTFLKPYTITNDVDLSNGIAFGDDIAAATPITIGTTGIVTLDIDEYTNFNDYISDEIEGKIAGTAGATVMAADATWIYDGTTWVKQGAQPTPTVIRIAGNKGTVGLDPQNVGNPFTVTPNQGYIAKVFIDGALATPEAGQYTAGGTNVIAYIKEDAWFLDPFVKNEVELGTSHPGSAGNLADVALANNGMVFYGIYNGNWFASQDAGGRNGIFQFDTADLNSYIGSYFGTPVTSVYGNKTLTYQSVYEGVRAIIPVGSDFILVGNQQGAVANNGASTVYPMGQTWFGEGDTRFYSTSDINNYTVQAFAGAGHQEGDGLGLQWTSTGVVSSDGNYLYQNIFARNEITKALITSYKNNDGVVTNVTLTKTGFFWHTGATHSGHAADAIALYNNGVKDIVYAVVDGNLYMLDEVNMSGNTWPNAYGEGEIADYAMVKLVDSFGSTRALCVTGAADGTPHLIQQINRGATKVYALEASGTVAGKIAEFNGSDICGYNFQGFTAKDDETFAYANFEIGSSNHGAVICKKPAQVTVRGTFSTYENGTDTNITYGAAAEVAYTAPAGKNITAVKVNGVADNNFTAAGYTYSNAELTKNVYIEMTTEDQTFTVTFMNGDAQFAVSNNVAYGTCTAAPDPAPAAAEGFVFKGWTNDTCAAGFDFSTPITADLTLFACFAEDAGLEWPASWTEGKGTPDNLDKLGQWMEDNDLEAKDLTAALEGNFLMNAPATADVSTGLTITSIKAGDSIIVTVESNVEEVELSDDMPGVVVLKGANDLTGTWSAPIAVLDIDENGVAAYEGSTPYKFFKAYIDYPMPPVNND